MHYRSNKLEIYARQILSEDSREVEEALEAVKLHATRNVVECASVLPSLLTLLEVGSHPGIEQQAIELMIDLMPFAADESTNQRIDSQLRRLGFMVPPDLRKVGDWLSETCREFAERCDARDQILLDAIPPSVVLQLRTKLDAVANGLCSKDEELRVASLVIARRVWGVPHMLCGQLLKLASEDPSKQVRCMAISCLLDSDWTMVEELARKIFPAIVEDRSNTTVGLYFPDRFW